MEIYYPINYRILDFDTLNNMQNQQESLLVFGISQKCSESVYISHENKSIYITPGDGIISNSKTPSNIFNFTNGEISILNLYGDIVSPVIDKYISENKLLLPNASIIIKECEAFFHKNPTNLNSLSIKAYEIFLYIQKNAIPFDSEKRRYPEIVDAAIGIIINEFSYLYSIEEVADRIGTNFSYLSREFKKAVGVTPSQFLREKKIENAKKLLADESISITMVSEICGYSDSEYFSRVFKKEVGITPYMYRQSHSNKDNIQSGIPSSAYL